MCLQALISHYLVTPSNLLTPQDNPGQQLIVVLRGYLSLGLLPLTNLAYTNEKFEGEAVTGGFHKLFVQWYTCSL